MSVFAPAHVRQNYTPRPIFDRTDQPAASQMLMRRYSVSYLDENGCLEELQRIAPAIPAFEEAFSAFARGTTFETEQGHVAVEDLMPGDRLRVAGGGFRTLRWKGSCVIVPSAQNQSPEMEYLIRVAADSVGYSRPSMDCVFGPAARIFDSSARTQHLVGTDGAFVPMRDLIDGINMVKVRPATAVESFHLGFVEQERLIAAGLEVESYHTGPAHRFPLRGEMLKLFMSLMPHLGDILDVTALRYPRINVSDLEVYGAA